MPAAAIHTTPYSGSWYPGERRELERLLEQLWRESESRTGPAALLGARGFVVPHAGLIYSGRVAAAAYRRLERQRPRTVIVAGFAHRGAPEGIFVPDISGYQTPLGSVPVNEDLARRLASRPPFRLASEARLCDHSIEIQLPLLQKAAPQATVVPLYVSSLEAEERARAAEVLAELLTPETVLVASSDLTHYGRSFHYEPFPVDWAIADRLRRLDEEVMESAGSLREEFFLKTLRRTSATVCGYHPISLLLAVLRRLENGGELFQVTLDYQTSGEITGDYHHSVSYGALGYFPQSSFEVGPEEQKILLDLARRTLEHYQRTGKTSPPPFAPSGRESLRRRAGLFVTLHTDGKLRGCIGNVTPVEPLEEAVPQLTLAAALDDPRFDPLSPDERGVELEISILTPMKRVLSPEDVRAGEHGALLRLGVRQGLLLPQVATERGWNTEQFLKALGVKAGAGTQACWDPQAKLYVFRAQVIH